MGWFVTTTNALIYFFYFVYRRILAVIITHFGIRHGDVAKKGTLGYCVTATIYYYSGVYSSVTGSKFEL